MGILWIVIVGFVAGIIARLLSPGPNKSAGFVLTTVLGIAGAFLATFRGQTIGWYRPAGPCWPCAPAGPGGPAPPFGS
jgi:uncharacterized membrane protein YeaQ/YmgE (transglycosylase-associated protein family)